VLMFHNPTARTNGISVQGDTAFTINGIAPVLSGLDLSSASVASTIVSLQNAGRIAGTLSLTNGIVTGGQLTLQPVNMPANLSGNVIVPANVTVNLQGFTAVTTVTGAGYQISGALRFTGAGSAGVISTPGNFTVSSTGNVTGTVYSAGSLKITLSGTSPVLSDNGIMTAAGGSLTVVAPTVSGAAGLTLSGSGSYSSTGGVVSISATPTVLNTGTAISMLAPPSVSPVPTPLAAPAKSTLNPALSPSVPVLHLLHPAIFPSLPARWQTQALLFRQAGHCRSPAPVP
jgi:hypothetical protein